MKNFPSNWKTTFNLDNNDLSILTSLLLQKNWRGRIKVKVALDHLGVNSEHDISLLNDLVRFPVNSSIEPYNVEMESELLKSNISDINIFQIQDGKRIKEMIEIVNTTRISAVFCLDSLNENALV